MDAHEQKRLVFISYGGNIDASIAKLLCEFLEDLLGYKTAVYCTATNDNSTATPYGNDFSKSYMFNIKEAQVFVPLISENYMQSYTALIEMGAAYALDKKIIPFLVSGCDYNKLYPLYNIRNYEMHSIVDFDGFTKAMREICAFLKIGGGLSDEKSRDFIQKVSNLQTEHKTNVYKQKQIKLSCEKLFSDTNVYEEFIARLGREKIIDINVTNYIHDKIFECIFYFKDGKNVSDLIELLKKLGYSDGEYTLTLIGGEN